MLTAIFEAVGGFVNEQWQALKPGAPRVFIDVTDEAVNYSQDAPRVVFVPGREKWGRRLFSSQDGQAQPRQLFTRVAQVECHIWGINRTETEELVAAVARCAYTLTHGSFEPMSGDWLSKTVTDRGNVYLLRVEWQIPVARLEDPAVPVTSMPIEIGTI